MTGEDLNMNWNLKAIGNSKGYVSFGNDKVDISFNKGFEYPLNDIEIHAAKGKLGDSEDSFIYYYCAVNPETENFSLSADMRVMVGDEVPDYQTAYGLAVLDTDASSTIQCRHRNMLFVGSYGRDHEMGVRITAGYTDLEAKESDGHRILDCSRAFSKEISNRSIEDGSRFSFSLKKDDTGFTASVNGEEISFPGCSFLMNQEKGRLFVGFAVARKIGVKITNIRFNIVPGRISYTPEGAIKNNIPDYPFPRELAEEKEFELSNLFAGREVFVSPAGSDTGAGTKEDPLTMQKAINNAGEDTSIVLMDGVYYPDSTLIVYKKNSGKPNARVHLRAEHAGKAVISGARMGCELPLFVLLASSWTLDSIVFWESPASGLVICGNCNVVSGCEAYENGDTGILIVSVPGAGKRDWPVNNRVMDCISHDNCDKVCNNADGFGAKLRIGSGNSFYRCIAYNNIDDGFDLYTKTLFGKIEPVDIDRCIAYGNGHIIDRSGKDVINREGTGFKLGGENIPVAHDIWHSVAFDNKRAGFSTNRNTLCRMHYCYSYDNGNNGDDDFRFVPAKGDWICEGLSHDRIIHSDEALKQSMDWVKNNAAKKNILMLIASLGGGGAERVACKLASALCKRNKVSLMYFNKKEKTFEVSKEVSLVDSSQIKARDRDDRLLRYVEAVRFIKNRVRLITSYKKSNDIDVTVSLLNGPNFYNALSGGKGKKILSERNDPSRKGKRYRKRARFAYKRADHIVFQTERVQKQFSETIQRKSYIIPNPVTVSCYSVPEKRKKIVTVGRMVEQKNHCLLIRAFSQFHKDHQQHHLYIYGDGELRDQLLELSNKLDISEYVHFEGFCERICEEISDAEMFVLSSDYEGLSNALMEAMMMGIACITTDCTGAGDLVDNGVNGLIVPVGDEEALASGMSLLSDDPELREKLGIAAMERADEFRPENIIRKWERIMQ